MLRQFQNCIEIIDAICLSWYSVQLLEVTISAVQNEPGIHPGLNCQLSPESRRIMSDYGVGLRLTCISFRFHAGATSRRKKIIQIGITLQGHNGK